MDATILHTLDHACALLGIARLHEELLTTLGHTHLREGIVTHTLHPHYHTMMATLLL